MINLSYDRLYLQVCQDCHLPPLLQKGMDQLRLFHVFHSHLSDALKFYHVKPEIRVEATVLSVAAQALADTSSTVNFSVDALLIAKCIKDLTDQFGSLLQSYERLKYACVGEYPLVQKKEIKIYRRLLVKIIHIHQRIEKIAYAAIMLGWAMFESSMFLMDVELILKKDPSARIRACTNFVIDYKEYREFYVDELSKIFSSTTSLFTSVFDRTFDLHDVIHSLEEIINLPLETTLDGDKAISFDAKKVSKVIKEEMSILTTIIKEEFKEVSSRFTHNHQMSTGHFHFHLKQKPLVPNPKKGPHWQGQGMTRMEPPKELLLASPNKAKKSKGIAGNLIRSLSQVFSPKNKLIKESP